MEAMLPHLMAAGPHLILLQEVVPRMYAVLKRGLGRGGWRLERRRAADDEEAA